MTPEAQRIAIAEACGWKIQDGEWLGPENHNAPGFRDEDECWHDVPPDYLSDLNAMHEAEKVLTEDQRQQYSSHLQPVGGSDDIICWDLIHATAAQRAEAFLRTLNLWNKSK